MPECGLSVDGHGAVVSSFLCKRYFQQIVFPAWSADGRPEIPLLVIPPEPPVAEIHRPTTARRGSRARLGLARRSAPLTPSTVVVGHHLATGGLAGITRTSCILLVSSEPQGKMGDSKGGRNRRLRPPLACPAGLAPRCSTVTFKLRSTAVGSRYPFSPHRLEVIQSLPPVLNRLPFCDHIPQRQVQQLHRRIFTRKRASRLDHFSQAHMQRLHRIGRVDHPPHLRRKLEKWNHSLPVLPPQPSNRQVFVPPLGDELVQFLFGTLFLGSGHSLQHAEAEHCHLALHAGLRDATRWIATAARESGTCGVGKSGLVTRWKANCVFASGIHGISPDHCAQGVPRSARGARAAPDHATGFSRFEVRRKGYSSGWSGREAVAAMG